MPMCKVVSKDDSQNVWYTTYMYVYTYNTVFTILIICVLK